MKITITRTDAKVWDAQHGVSTVWEGITEAGNRVTVAVAYITCDVDDKAALAELQATFAENGTIKPVLRVSDAEVTHEGDPNRTVN